MILPLSQFFRKLIFIVEFTHITSNIYRHQTNVIVRKLFTTTRNRSSKMEQLLKTRSTGFDRVPLIVIIGATGCGKTKLSIELAKRYDGEVISADSMQIYKGLDIATNKATPVEQDDVPHYLLDEIDPFKQFTVLDFQKLAMQKIESILERQKIPIIVGGTNYYIESVLWDTLVGSAGELADIIDDKFSKQGKVNNEDNGDDISVLTVDELLLHEINYRKLRSIPDDLLHRFLSEIDPASAETLHPHNRRKIIRCLQVYQQTGKLFSQILAEQRRTGSRHGGPLRFTNAIILWVDCEKKVLDKRLDDRVDQMLKLGLLDELQQFHCDYYERRLRENKNPDYTEGIFQAIGFKEFHRYLLLDKETQNSYDGSLELGKGIILLKERTKSYVTKQLKWIRRRFLVTDLIRKVPNVYRLDTTFPQNWKEEVFDKAVKVIDGTIEVILSPDEKEKEIIRNELLNPLAAQFVDEENLDDSFISKQFYCEICQVLVSGGKSYRMHLNSKGHKFQLKKSNPKTSESNKLDQREELSI